MAINYGTKFTITTGDNFLPTKHAKDLLVARENALVFGKWSTRYDVVGAKVLKIPNLANLAAAGTIDANGDLSDVTPGTDSVITLNLDKKNGYILNIPFDLELQSQYNLVSAWSKKAGYGLGNNVDTTLAALESSSSLTPLGDTGSDVTYNRVLKAREQADLNNWPADERYLVLYPTQTTPLLDTDKITNFSGVPYSKSDSPLLTGEIAQIAGFRVAQSLNVVNLSPGRSNLAFHKEAIALGMLRDVVIREFAETIFARRIGASMYWGSVAQRTDHILRVLSR